MEIFREIFGVSVDRGSECLTLCRISRDDNRFDCIKQFVNACNRFIGHWLYLSEKMEAVCAVSMAMIAGNIASDVRQSDEYTVAVIDAGFRTASTMALVGQPSPS